MQSEINAAPIIDVMLVLLIIFMVMTPLTQTGLDVSLPATGDASQETSRDVMLDIDSTGRLRLNEREVAADELPSAIRLVFEARADKTLFLRADDSLRYAQVVAVLDVVRGGGVQRVGIVSH